MVKLQSFVFGMAIAGAMVGVLLLVVSFVSGDDSPESLALSSATATPLTGAVRQPTSVLRRRRRL